MSGNWFNRIAGLGLLCFPILISAGQTWDDLKTNGQWVPAIEMQPSAATCRGFPFVASFCDTSLKSLGDTSKVDVKLEYFVIGPSWGGEKVMALRSLTDGHLTTTVAIEHLTQRMISLVLWVLILLTGVVAMFRKATGLDGEDDSPVEAALGQGAPQVARLNGMLIAANGPRASFGKRR